MSYRDLFNLSDKVILVSGAAGGLAEETCLALAEFGATLFLADIDQNGLSRISNRLAASKSRIAAQTVDITDASSVQNLLDAVREKFGRLDILINFAGILRRAPIESIKFEEFQKVITINLLGSFLLVKHSLPLMSAKRSGKIILVGSVSGQIGRPYVAHYAASKGGIHAMVRSMAVELAKQNIQINSVAPAYTLTQMTQETLADPEVRQSIINTIPMGRLGLPADLVGTIILLAGSGSNFITGQTIFVDGGCTSS